MLNQRRPKNLLLLQLKMWLKDQHLFRKLKNQQLNLIKPWLILHMLIWWKLCLQDLQRQCKHQLNKLQLRRLRNQRRVRRTRVKSKNKRRNLKLRQNHNQLLQRKVKKVVKRKKNQKKIPRERKKLWTWKLFCHQKTNNTKNKLLLSRKCKRKPRKLIKMIMLLPSELLLNLLKSKIDSRKLKVLNLRNENQNVSKTIIWQNNPNPNTAFKLN